MAPARLKDVAKACGVSVSTASRALNNRGDVCPQTRRRVLQAAEQLGYVPSTLAKGLWSGETMTVGVLVTTILNPFYANVVTGIEEILSEAGYTIFLSSSHEDPQLELRALKAFLERRVDGIILAPVKSNPEAVNYLEKSNTPFVLVGRGTGHVRASQVVGDDRLVGRLAAEHLLSRGHRRILFINSAMNLSAELRLEGFRSVLREAGLEYGDNWVRSLGPGNSVGEILAEMLSGKLNPSAVFCFCDKIALDLIGELKRKKVSIPEDVAVMGVDNLSFTELLQPTLTSIDIQQDQMGIQSAEILFQKMTGTLQQQKQVVLAPRLIIRDST